MLCVHGWAGPGSGGAVSQAGMGAHHAPGTPPVPPVPLLLELVVAPPPVPLLELVDDTATQTPVETCPVSQWLPGAQSASWLQPQSALATTHTGVPGFIAQRVALVAEHCVHAPANGAPAGSHAGSCGVGQAPGAGVDE